MASRCGVAAIVIVLTAACVLYSCHCMLSRGRNGIAGGTQSKHDTHEGLTMLHVVDRPETIVVRTEPSVIAVNDTVAKKLEDLSQLGLQVVVDPETDPGPVPGPGPGPGPDPEPEPESEPDLVTMDAYAAKGRALWAVLPESQRYCVLLRPPWPTRVDLRQSLQRVAVTNATERYIVSKLLPFVLKLEPTDAAETVTMTRPAQRRLLERAPSSSQAQTMPTACGVGTPAQLRDWFGDMNQVMPVEYGERVDTDRLNHVWPHARIGVLDVSTVFQVHTNEGRLQSLLVLDTLLVQVESSRTNFDQSQLAVAMLDSLFSDTDTMAATGFYTRLPAYPMATVALQRLRRANTRKSVPRSAGRPSVGRSATPILLERFSSAEEERAQGPAARVHVVPVRPVPGYLSFEHGGAQKVFELEHDEVTPGLVLQPGDRVELRNQERADENGEYIAENRKRLLSARVVRLQGAVPDMELSTAGSLVYKVPLAGSGADDWRPGDRIVVPELGNELATLVEIEWTPRAMLGRVVVTPTRRSLLLEDLGRHPLQGPDDGECVTDPSIKNKGQCESAFDAAGKAKPGGAGVWDERCQRDTDCPFFQANKNYKNYRGGCVSGYCEMPLGLDRVGFRKVARSSTSYPLCHGCGDDPEAQPRCCESQQHRPDYAFELDSEERRLQAHAQSHAQSQAQSQDWVVVD